MNCTFNFRSPSGLRFRALLCLFFCFGLASCDQIQQNKKSNPATSEETEASSKIFMELAIDGLKEVPEGHLSVKDTIECTFKVSTKDPEGNGPGGVVYSHVDSIHLDLRMTTVDPYQMDSVVNMPLQGAPECEGGTLNMASAQFKTDSTSVLVPVDILIHDVDCLGSVLEIGGGLIVVVEESMPDGPLTITMEKISAWKTGKSVPVEH